MTRVKFDDKMEKDLDEILLRLQSMGIKNATRTDAVRFMIEMNRAVQVKVRRKPRSKFGFIFQ